ncbi:MAG: hypothetical protein GY865_08995 [candidate division Zixibacteria bacterium]|nr:hypothetical protein [candidate division Zixibacteria bacterium]
MIGTLSQYNPDVLYALPVTRYIPKKMIHKEPDSFWEPSSHINLLEGNFEQNWIHFSYPEGTLHNNIRVSASVCYSDSRLKISLQGKILKDASVEIWIIPPQESGWTLMDAISISPDTDGILLVCKKNSLYRIHRTGEGVVRPPVSG